MSASAPYYSSHYSPWNDWTVVAAPHFGYGYVHQRVVHVDRVFAAQSRPVFVLAPVRAGVSRASRSRRGAAPIRWAGARGVAVTRGRRDAIDRRARWTRQQLFPARQQSRGPRGRSVINRLRFQHRHRSVTVAAGRSAAPRSSTGQGTSTSAPRAVPRSSGSVPMYQSRPSVGAPGTSANPGPSEHDSRDTARRRAGPRPASARRIRPFREAGATPAGRTQRLRHPSSDRPAQDRVAGAGASRA